MIGETVSLAREVDGEPVAITFGNHPDQLLKGRSPQSIVSVDRRIEILAAGGIETVVLLDFDDRLRDLTATRFARELFFSAMSARGVVLGPRSRFGRGGEGSAEMLAALVREEFEPDEGAGFAVREAAAVLLDGEPISSTRVRRAIRAGELGRAREMLGRPVALCGTVRTGDGRGRTLGFPTANLALHHEVKPPRGVYGTELEIDGVRKLGLLNLGIRPTFAGNREKPEPGAPVLEEFVEVHVLEFSGDLYGRVLDVEIVDWIREERKFSGVSELVAQIHRDREAFLERVSKGRVQKSLTSGSRNL